MDIESIGKFVKEYLDKEHYYTQNSYNPSITDKAHKTEVKKFLKKYAYYSLHDAYGYLRARLLDDKTDEELKAKRDNFKKRKLFLIQEYKNPTYGDGLDHDAKPENPLFVAYISTEDEYSRDRAYHLLLHITLVEGEYRISAIRVASNIKSNNVITGEFLIDGTVEDLGTLVQSKKYQAPTAEPYRSHYNNVS